MKKTKEIAYLGILAALAVVLAVLEQFVPLQALIPLPGVKIGMANIVTAILLKLFGFRESAAVLLVRCSITAFLFGTPVSFAMSVTGGVFALIGMWILFRFPKRFSVIGVSIAGAALHNIGQVICAMGLMKNIYVLAYLPVLLLVAIFSGALVGTILFMLFKRSAVLQKNQTV